MSLQPEGIPLYSSSLDGFITLTDGTFARN